jgi:hypothetical protein
MKRKKLNICRLSKVASVVKSGEEPVTGGTLRNVVDDDDHGDNINSNIMICLNQ